MEQGVPISVYGYVSNVMHDLGENMHMCIVHTL